MDPDQAPANDDAAADDQAQPADDQAQDDQGLADKVKDTIPGKVDDAVIDTAGAVVGKVGDVAGGAVDKAKDLNPFGGDDDNAEGGDSADDSGDQPQPPAQ